jgi:hypothetical protein
MVYYPIYGGRQVSYTSSLARPRLILENLGSIPSVCRLALQRRRRFESPVPLQPVPQVRPFPFLVKLH